MPYFWHEKNQLVFFISCYMDFLMSKVWQILKHFAGTFRRAQTLKLWGVATRCQKIVTWKSSLISLVKNVYVENKYFFVVISWKSWSFFVWIIRLNTLRQKPENYRSFSVFFRIFTFAISFQISVPPFQWCLATTFQPMQNSLLQVMGKVVPFVFILVFDPFG